MITALTRLTSLTDTEKERRGLRYTPGEIAGQVELWEANRRLLAAARPQLRSFLDRFQKEEGKRVICCGAGSSEFVGHCLAGLLQRRLRLPVEVLSTARIVTTPAELFLPGAATLLVSFARSGNSPESLGALRIAGQYQKKLYHLVITCNPAGALARETNGLKRSYTLQLDERTNDQALAMTASFSSMVTAGQMVAYLRSWSDYGRQFRILCRMGQLILDRAPNTLEEVTRLGFDRAVFLGDGAHLGTAMESHLKLQELTAGKVMCAWDTFPGLRHGPQAVIHSNTLVVAFLAADRFVQRYQLDLLEELRRKRIGRAVLAVCQRAPAQLRQLADFVVESCPADAEPLPDSLSPPVFVMVGQLLGLLTSVQLGLSPDEPSPTGVIHRVVQGVRVYDPRRFAKTGELSVLAES